MWFYIICAGAASASIVLVAMVGIWAIREVVRQFKGVALRAEQLSCQSEELVGELRRLLSAAEDAAATAAEQGRQLQGFIHSASQLGEACSGFAGAMQQLSESVTRSADRRVRQAANKYGPQLDEALNWAEAAMTAWQWWKKKCSQASPASESRERGGGHDKYEGSDGG
ncbi:hypothetical protein [Paenibacillus sp. SYP-B4298]|uniref:hypothetical protein n=1 Tax=Paenibacillus sp. SYP-B4298 TaxID=2996034 RepID=UPI0022DD54C1|nr:hypothetical protein [Paenibacillus sp. SYP-B4298]